MHASSGVLFAFIVPLWIIIGGSSSHSIQGRKGLGGFEQEWGHVTVRPDAHMFWWLFYTTANVSHFVERPLLIWLQGGPGMPSSGYGNFVEIGPLNIDLSLRDTTWVKLCNVLFIDNPVGVGFSYFSDSAAKKATNNEEIGHDLVVFLRTFLQQLPEFRTVPTYIFGESYGGKMAVEFARQILQEEKNGNMKVNLKGIGLGDAYISPIHYILNYGPFALNLGIIDQMGYDTLQDFAKQVTVATRNHNYTFASEIESKITETLLPQGIDIYNIETKSNGTTLPGFLTYQDRCNALMNSVVKEVLNISSDVQFKFINERVYMALQDDLMRPVTDIIESFLNETNLKVIVYNGAFDFIVNTAGTSMWLNDLKWEKKTEWYKTSKQLLQIGETNEGYVKKLGNLVFYSILRAGHSVPVDNPVAMEYLLKSEVLNLDMDL